MKLLFFEPQVFIYIKLMEFIAGSATLGYMCLYHDYHVIVPNLSQFVGYFAFGMYLAFIYEMASFYFVISALAWSLLSSLQRKIWLPISVPAVYMAHTTLWWKYFSPGHDWPWGILVVALLDYSIAAFVLRRRVTEYVAR